jgi:hypothetical protein
MTLPPSPAEIEARAYQIYLARGAEPGHDMDDWLEAERQLTQASAQEMPDHVTVQPTARPLARGSATAAR